MRKKTPNSRARVSWSPGSEPIDILVVRSHQDSAVAALANVRTFLLMSAPETTCPAVNESFPEGSVEAGVYATQTDGLQHSLVVLAMGQTCWLISADDGYHLRVEPPALDAVLHQLALFDRESVGWPPTFATDAASLPKHAPLSPWFWVLSLFATFWAQEQRASLTNTGLLDGRRVFEQGEWWRAGSALWLHASIEHLISNAGSGLLVFSAAVITIGARAAWCLIAAAAIAGNLAAAAIHAGKDYRSLGASTAVFAGLGLLTGRAVRVMGRASHPHRWRTILIPLISGVAVLGLYGAGGVNIDVLAHATGFAAGLVLGFFHPLNARQPGAA